MNALFFFLCLSFFFLISFLCVFASEIIINMSSVYTEVWQERQGRIDWRSEREMMMNTDAVCFVLSTWRLVVSIWRCLHQHQCQHIRFRPVDHKAANVTPRLVPPIIARWRQLPHSRINLGTDGGINLANGAFQSWEEHTATKILPCFENVVLHTSTTAGGGGVRRNWVHREGLPVHGMFFYVSCFVQYLFLSRCACILMSVCGFFLIFGCQVILFCGVFCFFSTKLCFLLGFLTRFFFFETTSKNRIFGFLCLWWCDLFLSSVLAASPPFRTFFFFFQHE